MPGLDPTNDQLFLKKYSVYTTMNRNIYRIENMTFRVEQF